MRQPCSAEKNKRREEDGLFRRVGACHGAMGIGLCGSGAGPVKGSGRSGRTLHVCGHNGDQPCDFREIRRQGLQAVFCAAFRWELCGRGQSAFLPGNFLQAEPPCSRCWPWQETWAGVSDPALWDASRNGQETISVSAWVSALYFRWFYY